MFFFGAQFERMCGKIVDCSGNLPKAETHLSKAKTKSKFVESKTLTHNGRVGSGGARRGGWAGQAWQDGTPTGQDTTGPRALQGIEDNCLEQGKPYLNRWRNKASG